MRIANNISAFNAFNALNSTNQSLSKVINTLSTGLRINSAADDAAGFAISEKLRSQIGGLDTALRNSQDGISLLQTAEGALEQTNSMLQRMRDLSVQASNDSLTSTDRQYIQLEIDQLRDEIDRIAGTTQFNKKRILDGSSGALWASSDPGVRAIIHGGLTRTDNFGQKITSEGNYRIEVTASPGEAQVQKSNIMFIKHKNVAMDKTINYGAGVQSLEIDNLPAGYFKAETELPNEARAIATGVYGMTFTELDGALSASVQNSKLTSNASILFEVSSVDYDSGSITVRAEANVLHTDGTTEKYIQSDIVLSEGNFKDLSEILGVGAAGTDDTAADGAFELRLNAGSTRAFEAGDKFVYNLNTAKDTEGADRVVKFTNEQNTKWPDHWEETEEIYKTNQFKGVEPIKTSSKILFLIDFSGSMGTPIATVKNNIRAFVNEINAKAGGASDVQIGIATYVDGLQHHSFASGKYWSSDLSEIESLLSFAPHGGDVDAYKAIREAAADSSYDMSDVGNRYMVLITDTCQEYSDRFPTGAPRYTSTEFEDLKNAVIDDLKDKDITFSAVRPETLNWEMDYYDAAIDQAMQDFDPIINDTDGMAFNQRATASWGAELVSGLGSKIGTEIEETVKGIPLYKLTQFTSIFPDSSSTPKTLTVTRNGISTSADIYPDDTLATLAEKIETLCGGAATIKLHDELDDETFVSINSKIEGDSRRIKFSGSKELINIVGLRSNFEWKFSLDASEVTEKDIHFRNFFLDSTTGKVYDGDITLTTNETEMPEYDLLTNFETAYIGQIPKHDVCIRDINNFWDSQGVFIAEHPKTITITQGDGQTSSVTIYATDTVEDVRSKLNDAIGKGLGQLEYTDANNFVSFVKEDSETAQSDESVAGTFVIRSAVAGKSGELSFSGDEEILRAFGLNTIREASETKFTASIYDAHSGKVILSGEKMTGNVIHDALTGVDIEFSDMAGIKSHWDENTKRYIFTGGEKYSAVIHLKDHGITFHTGANMGEDFSVQLGDMSCSALGINGVNVSTRESASRSISTIDRAITRVSSQRAKIGSYINGLEHTMSSLTTTTANLTAADSRLRDADMALTMMDFVRLQILNQSGTSMLAQANQLPQSVLSLLQG